MAVGLDTPGGQRLLPRGAQWSLFMPELAAVGAGAVLLADVQPVTPFCSSLYRVRPAWLGGPALLSSCSEFVLSCALERDECCC